MFLGKVVPKMCNKFAGEHTCRSVISKKLFCNFIEIALWRGGATEWLIIKLNES